LVDYWDETQEADFDVDIESEVFYYALMKTLSERVQSLAQKQGLSADTLVNLWVQEKLQQEA
jgi:hypothetical protein